MTVAKSKSMLTEGVDLEYRPRSGRHRAVETDLGEWIIQLAGEPPSHTTPRPSTRPSAQVAALFSQALGQPDPRRRQYPELSVIAR
ncbi:MAG: hypothetical protein KIS91_01925 [Anaerolineae bacterium]|nr:hypothetical protein [Anaerolineae bacterium]